MSEYTLFGTPISFTPAADRYFKLLCVHKACVTGAKADFATFYKQCGNISNVLDDYVSAVYTISKDWAIDYLYNAMLKFEIYDISRNTFEEACWDLEQAGPYYEAVANQYNAIIGDVEQAKAYRSMRKSCRTRIVGGGFGISGAVKGIATAETINVATGIGHSMVNAVGNIGSSIAASSAKKKLYNNTATLEVLQNGLIACIDEMFYLYHDFINEYMEQTGQGLCFESSAYNVDKANALFENALTIPEKREDLLCRSFALYPFNRRLHSYIFTNYKDEQQNIWNIAQDYKIDLQGDAETLIENTYTQAAKTNENAAQIAKKEILRIMHLCGMKECSTLDKLECDCLNRIAKPYCQMLPEQTGDVLAQIRNYDAATKNKQHIIIVNGIWELAEEYDVTFSDEKKEIILDRTLHLYIKSHTLTQEELWTRINVLKKQLGVTQSKALDNYEQQVLMSIGHQYAQKDFGETEEITNAIRQSFVSDRAKKLYIQNNLIWELAPEYHISFKTAEQETIISKVYHQARNRYPGDSAKLFFVLDSVLKALSLLDKNGRCVASHAERFFDLLTGIGEATETYNSQKENARNRNASDISADVEAIIHKYNVTFATTSLVYEAKSLRSKESRLQYITLEEGEKSFLIYMDKPIMDPDSYGFCLTDKRLVGKTTEGQRYDIPLDEIVMFDKQGFISSYLVVSCKNPSLNRRIDISNLSDAAGFVRCINQIKSSIPSLLQKNQTQLSHYEQAYYKTCNQYLTDHADLIQYFSMEHKAKKILTDAPAEKKVSVSNHPPKAPQASASPNTTSVTTATPAPATPKTASVTETKPAPAAPVSVSPAALVDYESPSILKDGIASLSHQQLAAVLKQLQDHYRAYACYVLNSEHFRKALPNAQKVYARYDHTEQPLLLVDTSLFNNGKEGFLLTNKKIYIKGLWESPVSYPLSAVKNITVTGTDSYSVNLFVSYSKVTLYEASYKTECTNLCSMLLALISTIQKQSNTSLTQSSTETPAASQKNTQPESTPAPSFPVSPMQAVPTESEPVSSEAVGAELVATEVVPDEPVAAAVVAEEPATPQKLPEPEGKTLPEWVYELATYYRISTIYTVKRSDFAKKLPKAAAAYASYHPSETPVLLQDSTLFGSAKEGFLLTDKFFYIKLMFGVKVKYAVSEINSYTVEKNSNGMYYIYFNTNTQKQEVMYTSTKSEADNIAALLEVYTAHVKAGSHAPAPSSVPTQSWQCSCGNYNIGDCCLKCGKARE